MSTLNMVAFQTLLLVFCQPRLDVGADLLEPVQLPLLHVHLVLQLGLEPRPEGCRDAAWTTVLKTTTLISAE